PSLTPPRSACKVRRTSGRGQAVNQGCVGLKRKDKNDGRDSARPAGEGRHSLERTPNALLRVARPAPEPGAAASVVRLWAHVGVDRESPGLAFPRLRARSA